MLSYWYLSCSGKANFYVIHKQLNFCILYSVLLLCLFVVVLASLFVCVCLFVFNTNFYRCTLLIHVVTNRSLCENIKKHCVCTQINTERGKTTSGNRLSATALNAALKRYLIPTLVLYADELETTGT